MAQIDKPNLHFNTKLYTGTGSSNAITGVGFQPDFVWTKRRNSSGSHFLQDVVQGTNRALHSDSTLIFVGGVDGGSALTSFDSDGFTVGTEGGINGNGDNFVSWNWKAGGAGSANTDGGTSSTVSVNNTAGFSIVKWTGTSSNTTVGHGMNTAPTFTIVKNYGGSGTNWIIYHKDISPDYALKLNLSAVQSNSNNYWQSTAPTNSLLTFTGGTASNSNGNNMIGYCFAEKKGFSKFGSYAGNGSTDGPFVYTGFSPAYIWIKSSTYAGNWLCLDNKREVQNIGSGTPINLNESNGEDTNANYAVDFLSNGFKLRNNNGNIQNNGQTMVYAAFAAEPLVGSNDIPATAK